MAGIKIVRQINIFKSTLFSKTLQNLCKYKVAIMKTALYIKGKVLSVFKQVLQSDFYTIFPFLKRKMTFQLSALYKELESPL